MSRSISRKTHDIYGPEKRSEVMRRVKAANTHPEIHVRRMLHASGLRFRLHVATLPGRPDIVLPRYRIAIFVNGCLWHQHAGCGKATIPKTRRTWWTKKLTGNVERDSTNRRILKDKKLRARYERERAQLLAKLPAGLRLVKAKEQS